MTDDFAKRYTLASMPHNAAVYRTEEFLTWLKRLETANLRRSIAVAIMVSDIWFPKVLCLLPMSRLQYLLRNGVVTGRQNCSKILPANEVTR